MIPTSTTAKVTVLLWWTAWIQGTTIWSQSSSSGGGSCDAFQFMKDWKMPTYDPNEDAVKERFGDKSKLLLLLLWLWLLLKLLMLQSSHIKPDNIFYFSFVYKRTGGINRCIFGIGT
jgi:hypothetical protein